MKSSYVVKPSQPKPILGIPISEIPNGSVFYADAVGTGESGLYYKSRDFYGGCEFVGVLSGPDPETFGGRLGGRIWTCEVTGYRPVTKLSIEVEF